MSTKNTRTSPKKGPVERATAGRNTRPTAGRWIVIGVLLAIATLGVLYFKGHSGPAASANYKYQVGVPGPGLMAPDIRLAATNGGTFDLASMRGKTVLLYFQEGLTCQPCWDQLVDIQKHFAEFQALGIDQIVTVTTDPLDQIQQKVTDEGITTPVLSDPDLAVSSTYHANSYGMMGNSRDGHSFIVVGPDGKILWRADYGGPPDFTMYLPVDSLVADIQKGLGGAAQ